MKQLFHSRIQLRLRPILTDNPVHCLKTKRQENEVLNPCSGLESLTDMSLYLCYLCLKCSHNFTMEAAITANTVV